MQGMTGDASATRLPTYRPRDVGYDAEHHMHNAVEGQPIVFHLARSPWRTKDILLSDQLPGGLPAVCRRLHDALLLRCRLCPTLLLCDPTSHSETGVEVTRDVGAVPALLRLMGTWRSSAGEAMVAW